MGSLRSDGRGVEPLFHTGVSEPPRGLHVSPAVRAPVLLRITDMEPRLRTGLPFGDQVGRSASSLGPPFARIGE